MDQHRDQSAMSDSAAEVGEKVGNLAAQAQGTVRHAIDRGKPMLHNLQGKAGDAMGQATDIARQASSAGVQAVAVSSGSYQSL